MTDDTVVKQSLFSPAHTTPLHKVWWAVIPVLAIIVQFIIENSFDATTLSRMHSEDGLHEFLQFVLLLLAFFVALMALFQTPVRRWPWLGGWMGLAAVCCFYVAGEEVSWGQHLFGWATPEFWETVNDQQETNLHNTSSWLDQKPRLVLEIGVIIGGLILPLLMKYRPKLVPTRFSLIYPPPYLAVIAGTVLALKLIDLIIEDTLGIVVFQRGSEVIELYLFYFVLLYLIVMRRRILTLKQPQPESGPL